MLWLHVRVHAAELRALIAGRLATGDWVLQPLVLACPQCQQKFFAALPPPFTRAQMHDSCAAALTKLAGDCPDHPHAFEAGP